MRGAFPRGSKLSSVRLTLSKLDAKYSKTSMVPDEDLSDEIEAEDELRRPTSPPILLPTQSQGQDKINNVLNADSSTHWSQMQVVYDLHDDGSAQKKSKNSIEKCELKNFPPLDDNTSLAITSSIKSVETDSVLDLYNVHSVSSLAESVLPFDNNEEEADNFTTLHAADLTKHNSLMLAISITEHRSGINSDEPVTTLQQEHEPLLLSENMAGCFEDTSASKIKDKSIVSKSCTNTNKSSKSVERNQSKKRAACHCKCACLEGHERKSIGIQTESSFKVVEPCIVCNKLKAAAQTQQSSICIPVMKATKPPSFLKEDFSKPISQQIFGVGVDTAITSKNELSELISYHLQLIKEFLQRQHTIYIANCRAVQLLEKGYHENSLEGNCKCSRRPTVRQKVAS